MDKKNLREEALRYHEEGRPGKVALSITKPCATLDDLALAYTPGVAEPCKDIQKNPNDAYRYTNRGNLVAVISNGTAVLGLGNIGALAGKPVMEGKAVFFKYFADVDAFDIEVDASDPKDFINVVKAISPTFGAINLEDIKAPQCFEIEDTLRRELDIPIMHDDQHGTAIISGAGLINALGIAGKNIGDVRVVVNGAGAAAIACSKMFIRLGVKRENLMMLDSRGVISTSRTDLNEFKEYFAVDTHCKTLEEAINGADVFLGLSKGGVLTPEMLNKMNADPIVFALANPDPEISYELARATRKDVLMATGRSDSLVQINNASCFPYIFRAALDTRSKCMNEAMEMAAVYAIASVAKEPIYDELCEHYPAMRGMSFGRDYFIPKPIDKRLLTTVAPAVARAAMESGAAREPIADWDAYKAKLRKYSDSISAH